MCLIVFAPDLSNCVIRKPVLQRGFEGNSHGCGFAYIENGQLKLQKGYFSFESFYRAYKQVRERVKTGPILIHFRYATCGKHNRTNSQPININHDMVMAHNGVFSELSFENSKISDSVVLARSLAKTNLEINPATGINIGYRQILEALCSGYSKLVFMDKSGNWDIVNSNLGCWRKGCWYSDKGECLKREAFPGFYKTKKWKKDGKGTSKIKKVEDDFEDNWCLPPNNVFQPTYKPVKQTTFYPNYRSPFGGKSSTNKPLVYGGYGYSRD